MKKVFALLIACCFASGTLRAQTHWTPQTAQYSGAMGMFCVAEIDGVEQLSDQLELGVFCGDECRASAMAQAFTIQGTLLHYLFIPTVAGEDGHQLTFKLYDHSISQELNLIGPDPITFQENGYGTPIVPFVVSFTSPTLLTQTIALSSAKVNYCSFYVDITLEDLQTAITDALGTSSSVSITIKSQTANSIYVPRTHRWNNGDLTWDVANMYQIILTEDCEITLEGAPINPADHPITIAGGGVSTWIGFPFSESMTLTEAFAALPPTNGDNVKYQNANAIFSRNNWTNGITQLEPGKGYIYKSASNAADRTLVFPTNAKKAAKAGVKGTVNDSFTKIIKSNRKINKVINYNTKAL